jgi:hypothetical protein
LAKLNKACYRRDEGKIGILMEKLLTLNNLLEKKKNLQNEILKHVHQTLLKV